MTKIKATYMYEIEYGMKVFEEVFIYEMMEKNAKVFRTKNDPETGRKKVVTDTLPLDSLNIEDEYWTPKGIFFDESKPLRMT